MCTGSIMTNFENWRSLKGAFNVIGLALRPSDVLVSYGDIYYGIAYYGQRRMVLVKNFGELKFGQTQDPESSQWFLPSDEAMFNLLTIGNKRVIVVCLLRHFPELEKKIKQKNISIFEWLRLDGKIIFSNQPR